jgi:hypothetical protein
MSEGAAGNPPHLCVGGCPTAGRHRDRRAPMHRQRRFDVALLMGTVFLVKQLARGCAAPVFPLRTGWYGGVYTERSVRCLVNTQPPSLLAAHRPPDSIRLAVSEHAPRMRPPGRAVTDPKSGKSDRPGNARKGDDDSVLTLPIGAPVASSSGLDFAVVSTGGPPAGPGAAPPNPATARAAPTASPERASSIIPSKSPRTETPRRAASPSTQARRSWSRRMPTTLDLVVAMAR